MWAEPGGRAGGGGAGHRRPGPCEGRRPHSQAPLLQAFDDFIFAFFAVEMVIKMIALGLFGQKCYLGDTWNRLDFFIVMAGYGPSPEGQPGATPVPGQARLGAAPGAPRMRDGEVHSGGTGPGEWLGVGCQERDLSGAPCASTWDCGTDTGCPGWPVSGQGPPVLSGGYAFPASGQLGWANGMGIMSPASAHLLASAARVPWREPGARWPGSDLPSQHLSPLSMPLLCP